MSVELAGIGELLHSRFALVFPKLFTVEDEP